MSYTELEHGYQGLRSATNQPIFYVGDIGSVQQGLVGPVGSSIYRSSNRGELSDGCVNDDGCMGGSDLEGEGKQVLVGVCAMAKKSQSKPMKEILTRLEEFEYIKIVVFAEEVILKEPVEEWPIVDCLISFHSKGFPLDKAIQYANLRNPFIINNLPMQYDIQDRRRVYAILEGEGIEIPRYAVLDRDSADPKHHELVESEDHVEVNGVTFNKPFVEKPVSAEDHNIYIYYPTSAGGGSQRLFRKIGSRSSVYSPESRVRKTGSYIYEDFMPTDGTDVKVYTVGPDYAHAEARKSPALDGKVERDSEGKEIRYPVILSNAEKLISRKVCLAFKQTVCGFDLLRANGQSFVCDVNGFSFVKNSNKYYDDCAKILGNMILRELAPTLHIPWSVPFQLDDPPIVPTTFGKMMELRCVVAVIRHGDRTPKQKMKVEVRHPKFFEIFAKYDGYKHGHVKLKRPKQLQEILDTARSLLSEIQHRAAGPELEEKQGKLEQLKSVLEMYGHFSGINRKVQMKYQPRGRPRGSSSDDGNSNNRPGEPSLVLILKWGGELTPAGRIQAEELGRIFRCMYPGGQGRHLSGEYAGAQGLGLLRLHSTFRHDLKIYASDEGRVQMTAAAFAKGLLALEGELTPILVQMVKSANTNGLLDNDCDSSKYQNMVKNRLHELMQQDKEFTKEDREQINPTNALSINAALDFVKNPVRCCQHVHLLIQKLMDIVRIKKDDPKTKDAILYHGETWELMGRRWGKIEKDFYTKQKRFDISKIPDIYDCIKYDLQHNNHTLQFEHAEELYIYSKYLADIVIPQEYGLTVQEKLTIGQGICTPLLKKIRADLQRNIEEPGEETVNRLNPRYSHGVSSPGRHVRTRLYFTSESHVHSLLTVLRYGGLLDVLSDEQWRRAMEYVSMVSELNYMSQIVVMLYEDPTKDPSSEERFHVELHFSPGVNCCVQKNLPPGPGFRPHSRNESSQNLGEAGSGQDNTSQCSTRIEEEDTELGALEDDSTISPLERDTSPPLMEVDASELDSTLDSPTTTSRAINMMDLDPNIMDEPYDSGFLQSSAPIPISARTVAGHEAARLGSQLAASQRQRREREAGVMYEPRARSYDHQRQDKPEKSRLSRLQRCSEVFHEEPSALFGLSKPSSLAHSLSSPELVIPVPRAAGDSTSGHPVQLSPGSLLLGSSIPPPLITLHNTPLASPGAVASSGLEPLARTEGYPPATASRSATSSRDSRPLGTGPRELGLLSPAEQQQQHPPPPLLAKRYGRSHSALNLPVIEINGESVPSRLRRYKQPRPAETPDDDEAAEEAAESTGSPPPPDAGGGSRRIVVVVSARGAGSLLSPPTNSPIAAFPRRSRSPRQHFPPHCHHHQHHYHFPSHSHQQNSQPRLVGRRLSGSSASLGWPSSQQLVARRFSGSSASLGGSSQQRLLQQHRHSVSPNQLEALAEALLDKRSRSLSPAAGRCSCYNCNVSELIMQSRDLSPAERSNFRTYFARSLSHKFSNCSCYSLAQQQPVSSNTSSPCGDDELGSARASFSSAFAWPVLRSRGYARAPSSRWSGSCPELGPDSPADLPRARTDSLDSDSSRSSSNSSNSSSSSSSSASSCSSKLHLSCSLDCLGQGSGPSRCSSCHSHCYCYCRYCCKRCCATGFVADAAAGLEPGCDEPARGTGGCVDADCPEEATMAPWPGCARARRSSSRREPPGHWVASPPHYPLGCAAIEQSLHSPPDRSSSHRQPARRKHHRHRHSHRDQHEHRKRTKPNHQQHDLEHPTTAVPHHQHHHHQHHHHPYQHPFLRKLQQQRSFSSPDTRPSLIQPDPTCTARRHRHGISGQMSYFKLLGYNVNKKLTGSANSLFSTAVISGSSSAPNLKDMVPAHASAVAAIEGFGGVPPIRPLETLHNALSLRQLDAFLEMMTSVPLFRTPASSPPKFPSPLEPGAATGPHQNLAIEAARYITPTPIHYKQTHDNELTDLRNQLSPTSPNSTGWSSEPQSFLSSEPSSPAPTSVGECSMSMSLVSNDGSQAFTTPAKYSPNRGLELDYSDFCVSVEQQQHHHHQQQQPSEQQMRESRGSVSYTDYYSSEDGQIRRTVNDNCFPVFKPQLHQTSQSSTAPTTPTTTSAPTTAIETGQTAEEEENVEEDEDAHTLTLKQSDEQKKQDVQHIFEQKESQAVAAAAASVKPSSSYKKIGRFRVESMEITDDDVRIKEPVSLGSSVAEKSSRPRPEAARRSNNLLRSQSVYTPKPSPHAGSKSPLLPKQSSLSTGSGVTWQDSPPPEAVATGESSAETQPPALTLASSFTDKANVTFGFDVARHERKE